MCEELDEFRELASSAGADAVAVITAARKTPDARYFVGSGKAEEIRAASSGMVVIRSKACACAPAVSASTKPPPNRARAKRLKLG